MSERWVYKGSQTVPPCDTFVMWNIPRRVYPIKQKHVDLFKKQLERGGLQNTGNVREIQLLNGHQPYIVSTLRNILDVNIMNRVRVQTDTENGDIQVDYVNFNGEIASTEPQPNGLLKLTFEDFLKRTIEVISDGVCHNIQVCGFKEL